MSPGSENGGATAVISLWSIYALFAAGLQVQDGVAQTLFLKRIGADQLPLMFLVKALLDVLTALVYVRIVRRLGHHRTMGALLLLAAGAPAAWWVGVTGAAPLLLAALFAYNEALQTAIKMHWGVYLLDHFSIAAGQRSFPTIYTGARIGTVAGGVLLGVGAGASYPLASVLLAATPLFLIAALVVALRRPDEASDRRPDGSAFGPVSEVGHGLASGRRSPLVRAMAAATATMVICRFALRLRYSEIFAARLGEAALARYYGLYAAAANLGAAALQLLLTRWLLALAGITGANLLYAIAVPAAAALLWLRPGITAAVIARLVENEIKVAVKTPLSNLMYGALAPADRPAARALIFGLVVPAATVAAALLLQTSLPVGPWLIGLALLFVALSAWQNRAFSRTSASTAG